MQILYCDSCGYRIPEKDLAEGRTATVGGKTLCEKCRPSAGEKPSKSSKATIPLAGKTAVTRESSTSVQPVRFSESSAPSRAAPAAKPQANSNAMIIGITVGLAAAVLLVAFMSMSSSKPAHEPERTATQSSPPASPIHLQPPAPQKPEPTPPEKPVTEPPRQQQTQADQDAEASAEKEAGDAFDAVTRFEGLAEDDYQGRAARLGEFIAKYGNSMVSVRARKMQGDLKAKATGTAVVPATTPAAQPATPAAEKRAATAVFLKVDAATHGAWRGVYGADGYYLANYLDKKIEMRAKDQSLDILKKPDYLVDLKRNVSTAYRVKDADFDQDAALQDPAGNDRHLAVDMNDLTAPIGYHLRFGDEKHHQVALYFATGVSKRAQTIELLDLATRAQLDKRECPPDKFKAGFYMLWDVSGSVIIRITHTNTYQAICSGIFFDPLPAAAAQVPAVPVPATPGPATLAPVQPELVAAAQTPELLAELRKEAEPLLKAGRFSEALQAFEGKAKASRYAPIKDMAERERADIAALAEMKQKAWAELRNMNGKTVTLTSGGREISGTVKADAKRDDIALRMAAGAEISFGFDQLAPGDIGTLVPPADAGGRAEDLKRRGLLMLIKGDTAEAKSYFTGARKAGLGDAAEPYLKRVEDLELGETEAGAKRMWAKAESHFQAKEWKEALSAYEEFEKHSANTKCGAENAAVLKERLKDAEFNLQPLRPGLLGAYYKGRDFVPGNLLLKRIDGNVDFDWGLGSPAKEVPVDNFCIRWTGVIRITKPGTYAFATVSDDGSRLTIDGKKVIDQWVDHPPLRFAGTIELQPGPHEIVLDYFEDGTGAECHLRWNLKDVFADEIIPATVLFHDPKSEPATAAVPPKK